MISSMTGYGRAQKLIGGREISVEIKSVNHRFFEFSARIPRTCGYLEEKLKGLVYEKVSRGKLDVGVSIQTLDAGNTEVLINHELARSYLEALQRLGLELALPDDIALSALARFSDIYVLRKGEESEDEIWSGVREVALEALEAFLSMRRREGEKLGADLLGCLGKIDSLVSQAEQRYPKALEAYRTRLFQKLSDLLADTQPDPARLLTEAALFAEKTAVAEETVRLASHLSEFRSILSQNQPVGRKLDFLVQEINREANTIGSKSQDLELTRLVVEMKSEIEKIREQIQNIE